MIRLRVQVEKPGKRRGGRPWRINKLAVGLGYGVAKRLQQRVAVQGRTVQRFGRYDWEGRRYISPRYPVSGEEKTTRSGAKSFESSESFHRAAGTKRGTARVSGGMWGGLSVVPNAGADVKFRGRSEGQEPNFRRYKSGEVKARGRKVSNALKAGTVLQSKDVNLLDLTDEEIVAIQGSAVESVRRRVDAVSGLGTDWDPARLPGLVRAFIRSIERHQ